MEMVKIEQVIVGSEMRSTPTEVKPEPVVPPLQSYQHESLQCFQCFITFCNPKAKERHMRKSHREQYKQQLQQTNILFSCYTCDKCYSSSEELSQHQATHNREEKPFRCPYCQKNFFTISQLTKHRRYECAERRCSCKDCGAFFPSPSQLRSHRISMHHMSPVVADDRNTHLCCKCNCAFHTEEELLEHQERFANDLHCDVKPHGKRRGSRPNYAAQLGMAESKKIKQEEESGEYNESITEECLSSEPRTELKIPCPEANCDLVFPSVATLRAHKKERHGPPPRKAHKCTKCEESFARPELLRGHTASARCSGCLCRVCGKSFARESALEAHKCAHTEGEEVAEAR